MDDVAEGVLAFIRWAETHPLPPNTTTRDVLNALRGRLDTVAPGWRTRVFETATGRDAVGVELRLNSGRVVRGVLVQQPSIGRGEVA